MNNKIKQTFSLSERINHLNFCSYPIQVKTQKEKHKSTMKLYNNVAFSRGGNQWRQLNINSL